MIEILGFIPFLIIAAIFATAIYLTFSQRIVTTHNATSSVVKRLYFYGVLFVALAMGVTGTIQLTQFLLEEVFAADIIEAGPERAALGIALVLVGTPLWFFHWRLINKQVRDDIFERASGIRKTYIYFVLAISVAIVTSSLLGVMETILGVEDVDWYQVATIIPILGVWVFHWRLKSIEGTGSKAGEALHNVYIYGASAFGLVLVSIGLGGMLHTLLKALYDSINGDFLIIAEERSHWTTSTRHYAAAFISGLVLWSTHWLVFARNDANNRFRTAYLYIASIPAGGIISTVATGSLLYGVFSLTLGIGRAENGQILSQVPGSLSSLIVGLFLIFYHQEIATRESADRQSENLPNNKLAFLYSFSFIGIAVSAPGIATLFYTAFGAITETSTAILESSPESWRDPAASGLAMLILGGTIWGYIQIKYLSKAKIIESTTLPIKRIYFTGIIGIGLLIAVSALSIFIFVVLRDVLGGDLGYETVRSIRIPVSILVAFAVIVPYHWLIQRTERQQVETFSTTKTIRPRKKVTILAPPNSSFFIAQLEDDLGYPVTSVTWADSGAFDLELDIENTGSVTDAIAGSNGDNVIIIPEPGGLRVYSHD